MKYCSISWQPLEQGQWHSRTGTHKLSSQLEGISPLPLTAEQQRLEAISRADKMSIQGVQPKLSAVLKVKEGRFEIVDNNGKYILKPPHLLYHHVPENEALTMSLASRYGLQTPLHGLVPSIDGSYTYFVKRFDRRGHSKKVHQEDFAQLSNRARTTKYDSSMERVVEIIAAYCTFPAVERLKLFKRTLFSFVIGNEDMHLKNFSLIILPNKVELSPVYDLLNTSIILPNIKEELALPLRGRKRNLTPKDILVYFGQDRCKLPPKTIDTCLAQMTQVVPQWKTMIAQSYLTHDLKKAYLQLLDERLRRLGCCHN